MSTSVAASGALPRVRRLAVELPAIAPAEAEVGAALPAGAAVASIGASTPEGDGAFFTPAATARCPAEMALVDGRVCVDRWEASLVERLGAGRERAWSPFEAVDGHDGTVRAVSLPGVVPQGYISGEQARLACEISGKRLCSAEEWERACRGPRDTRFPYGNERRRLACNDDVRSVHPVAEAGLQSGLDPQRWWSEGMNDPLINQLAGALLATGVRAECTNEHGVYDMVGNLHEWIDDPSGTFRGGFYMDTALNGEGCAYETVAHDFRYHDYSTGFRCCMDADRVE